MRKLSSFTIVITATGNLFEATLPYLLASIVNQSYDLNKINILVTGCFDRLKTLLDLYQDLNLTILEPLHNELHLPTAHRYRSWQMATGEILLSVDADVILESNTLFLINEILGAAEPKTVIYGHSRQNLLLNEIQQDFAWQEINSKKQIDGEIFSIHPLNAASFLFAARRSELESADFCFAYDGAWGREDVDLAATLYERGFKLITHQLLNCWHWQHPHQSVELYRSQTDLLTKRHSIHKNDPVFSGDDVDWHDLFNLRHTWPVFKKGGPVWHGQDLSLPYSSTQVTAQLFVFSWVFAAKRGLPLPSLVDFEKLSSEIPGASQIKVAAGFSANLEPGHCHIWHVWHLGSEQKLPLKFNDYNIANTALEGDLLRPRQLKVYEPFDEIWVPDTRGANAFRRAGWVKPISVIPHGVNKTVFFSERALQYSVWPRGEGFTFLAVGTGFRKRNADLIKVFVEHFKKHSLVRLIIVDWLEGDYLQKKINDEYPEFINRIKIYSRPLSLNKLVRLYQRSDAIVTLSMGEAWGLPLLEAAATGALIIAPREPNHPFLTEYNSVLYESEPIKTRPTGGRVWGSTESLGLIMQNIALNSAQYNQQRLEMARQVPRRFSWSIAADLAWSRLIEIFAENNFYE